MYGTAKNSQQKKEDTACSQSQCITGVPVYKEIAYSTNQKTEKDTQVFQTGSFFNGKVFKNRIKKKTQGASFAMPVTSLEGMLWMRLSVCSRNPFHILRES